MLLIVAEQMATAGMVFYKSVNGVWLTKSVPLKYLRKGGQSFDMYDEMANEA